MKLYYEMEQYNNDGLVYQSGKIQAESFVYRFLSYLWSTLSSSGTGRTFMFINGGSGNTVMQTNLSITTYPLGENVGIVVGINTGDIPVSSTDYALTTKILEGITTGKLEHSAHTFTDVVVSPPSASYTVSRIFRNSSGGSIIIKEIGIAACYYNTDPSVWVRDVLAIPVTMLNGDYLKVTYTFQITA